MRGPIATDVQQAWTRGPEAENPHRLSARDHGVAEVWSSCSSAVPSTFHRRRYGRDGMGEWWSNKRGFKAIAKSGVKEKERSKGKYRPPSKDLLPSSMMDMIDISEKIIDGGAAGFPFQAQAWLIWTDKICDLRIWLKKAPKQGQYLLFINT